MGCCSDCAEGPQAAPCCEMNTEESNFRDDATFRFCDRERVVIDSIASRLTPEERKLRIRIISAIVEMGKAFDRSRLYEEDQKITEALQEKNVLTIDEDGKIYTIYPVSAKETGYKVNLANGRVFYAVSAVDALGAYYTFGRDVVINSQCAECGKDIRIVIQDGAIVEASEPDMRILYSDLKACAAWSSCTATIHYFCDQAHYDKWFQDNEVCPDNHFCLTLDEAFCVGRMLFSDDE